MISGVTVTVAVFVTPFALPLIVTVRGAGASVVTIENVALVPTIGAEAGTDTAGSLDVSAAVLPGDTAVKASVPFTVAPATTSIALNESAVGIAGVTVTICVCVTPPDVALILTPRGADTPLVVMGKLTLVPLVVTVAGTVTPASPLASATEKSATPAPGLSSVTTPEVVRPAITLVGLIVNELGRGVGIRPGASTRVIAPSEVSPPSDETVS